MKHEKVLNYIHDYGYNITARDQKNIVSYHCHNPLSKNEFALIILDGTLQLPNNADTIISTQYGSNLPFVYLIQVDDNIDEIVTFAQNASDHNKPFLIYDPNDEVEFFLKDLWNIIVDLAKD
ncbi:hypothetical protein [Petrocella sp. FN5]|uniref:hypothetical protein n=1 Tax=Petrocella sp. FN5 TaxID=3032002 RepID=UPI0023DC287F|nr:hypothetical protein [Petrocella sp. FN5]MDF1616090.1 hypothetical protein [Petrocella sp. FN5]